MNDEQIQLYNDLLALTRDGDTFYSQDFDLDGLKYRIFNYRLSSYTEFLKPGAMECRGIMFEMIGDEAVRLAARPMPKFFNLNENPMTMGLDLSLVDTVELKADGSLMSTFMHNGQLRFKSKGSLFSEQALDAIKWIESDINFKNHLIMLEKVGFTVNLEWCAPHNRIVIGYAKAHLKVLNARKRECGSYLQRDQLEFYLNDQVDNVVHVIDRVDTNGLDVAAFVQSIPAMQDDIEGYVARIGDLWFKIKTDKYLSLHHAKDSINNPRRLFEAIVDEGIDDLRSMFAHDQVAIQTIDAMQGVVTKLYNSMVATVEGFYVSHKELDRKGFAIAGRDKEKLDQRFFGLAMNLYLGKPVDYKDFMKSKYKEFGIRDTAVELATAE